MNLILIATKIAALLSGPPGERHLPTTFMWVKPDVEEERSEIRRVAKEEGLNLKSLFEIAKRSGLKVLSEVDWQRLENTDSYDVKSLDEAISVAEGYGRDVDRVIYGMTDGTNMPSPIVLEREDGSITLVAGNTRLMAARALGVIPKVLWINPKAYEPSVI